MGKSMIFQVVGAGTGAEGSTELNVAGVAWLREKGVHLPFRVVLDRDSGGRELTLVRRARRG
jgi:hypothetical protein